VGAIVVEQTQQLCDVGVTLADAHFPNRFEPHVPHAGQRKHHGASVGAIVVEQTQQLCDVGVTLADAHFPNRFESVDSPNSTCAETLPP
jgi:hypothetical protein